MKVFRFIKKMLFIGLTILSNFTNTSLINAIPLSAASLNVTTLSCISMKNQECKARPEIVNINRNNPIFYPFSVKTR